MLPSFSCVEYHDLVYISPYVNSSGFVPLNVASKMTVGWASYMSMTVGINVHHENEKRFGNYYYYCRLLRETTTLNAEREKSDSKPAPFVALSPVTVVQ
jgi:hypothetical protein